MWTLFNVGVAAAEPVYDYRIVIDVSGSMKKTDPSNLRVPALKLINGLVPKGSFAGVWTFGKYVNMTVKWGKVDDAWRKSADLGADQIHSNALLTNIESALMRASVGWKNPDPGSKRVLLLLTDGKVDVSRDPEKNRKSREAVLGASLASLKKAGAQVHGVALSDGTDEALLRQLALETGGSFSVASSAEQLQKVFFKMFERASNPDTVAIEGNEFPIDASIKEMTLLIFRKPGSRPAVLIPPDSPAISADKPRGVRWRSDQGYDLVTVAGPEKGNWRIDADMDPESRLMVVTDLKLGVDGIPGYANPDETLQVFAELFNRDRKISKNSFLRFVDFGLVHRDPDGNEIRHELKHSEERQHKGRYLLNGIGGLAEGMHSFVVSADSRTFSREKRFDLQVQWPVEVEVEPQGRPGSYRFKLRAREEYLEAAGLSAEVELEAPDGSREALRLQLETGWLSAGVDTDQDGIYRAHVKVSAQNHQGEIYDYDIGSFTMIGTHRAPEPVAIEAPAQAEEAAPDNAAPAPRPAAREQQDSTMILAVVGGVNLLLAVLAIVGWLLFGRRRASRDRFIESEELGV